MPSPTADEAQQTAVVNPEELTRWLDLVHELPDVRESKVVATREAVSQNRYDDEHILGQTIERISNDVAILCRQGERDGVN